MTLESLKASAVDEFNKEAYKLLQSSDWYVIRKLEKNINIPAEISTYRDAVRTVCEQRCTLINAVTTEDEFNEQVYKNATLPGLEPGTTIPVEGGMPDWPTEVN
tara:strand:+ start:954 stop:1265 length:312 start_codon:yes stop_codon:yes gene_type:complete